MGFTPAQVERMTLWEFATCVDGFVEFHTGKKRPGRAMSEVDLHKAGIEGLEHGE
jgi:hypothetical protein